MPDNHPNHEKGTAISIAKVDRATNHPRFLDKSTEFQQKYLQINLQSSSNTQFTISKERTELYKLTSKFDGSDPYQT